MASGIICSSLVSFKMVWCFSEETDNLYDVVMQELEFVHLADESTRPDWSCSCTFAEPNRLNKYNLK